MGEENAMTLVIKYFNRVLKPNVDDSVHDPRTIISALDFLWQALLFTNANLAIFLNLEGVYLLLDIIQMSSFPAQVIGLGCLVDMCTDDSCIPFLLTWRGGEKKQLNFYSLLAEIFYKECKKIGTTIDSNGVITDICFPLMAKQQLMDVFKPIQNKKSYQAVLDLQGSTRPKIYALLQIMKTRHDEKVKLTNEYFKMADMSLSKKHKVVLYLAENFFALKIGETWKELVLKLSNADIKPIDVDGQMLAFIINKMQKWNENVKDEQEQVLNVELENEAIEEYNVYELMKEYRHNEVMNAKREMIYLAKTSNRMFMLAEKRKENEHVANYLKGPNVSKCTFHPTYMDYVNFTNVFNLKYETTFNVTPAERKL